MFQAGEGSWQLGTLAVGNVDDDPQPDIVVPYRSDRQGWVLDAFHPDGRRLNGFPYHAGDEPINVSPTLIDLDNDGRAEIVFTQGNKVVVLDGRNGTPKWQLQISAENYVPTAGYQVVTNGFYWSADRLWRSHLPSTAVFSSEVSPPIVADIDGDGRLELLTAWKILPDATSNAQDFNPFISGFFGFADWGDVGEAWSGGVVVLDAATGQQKLIYHFNQLVESGLAIGRATETQRAQDVYVLNDSDSVVAFDMTKPYGFFGNGMLHKMFGKNQRLMSGSYLQGVDVYTVDLDGDGLDEVLVPTTQLYPLWQPNETILDDDGAIMWRQWKQEVNFENQYGWLNSACMIPINPDHDNHIDVLTFSHSYDIAFRYWNGVKLVDRSGWPKSFYPYLPTPPVVGDVDGDGEEEIIIGSYNPSTVPSDGYLYIYRLDGTLKYWESVPGGLKHIPTLADVDGNGVLDIIYRSIPGVIYIRDFGSRRTDLVSWATHRGNAQRNGNFGVALFPAGTPRITQKSSGCQRTDFTWKVVDGDPPAEYRIYRAENAEGPFRHLVTVNSSIHTFTDTQVKNGWQYFYEVAAVSDGKEVHSATFAITPLLNGNRIINGSFEEDDNSHWDKWFTGDIPWSNMAGSTNVVYRGKQSMEIKLDQSGNNSSISQYRQYGIVDAYIPVTPGAFYSFGGFMASSGISSPSQHWLEWNSSGTGEDTTPRPPLPWPDYFTPSLAVGREPVPWTYVNRVFTMPAGFPNVEIRHRFSIDQPGSGSFFMDDLFFRELPEPSSSLWQQLLPMRGQWRYRTTTPERRWYQPDFDDTSWPQGNAKFGCGATPVNVATPLPPFQSNYYFRRTFEVEHELSDLLLEATCTDNFNSVIYPLNVYLNGTELKTSGIQAVSGEGNKTLYFDLTPFLDLIHTGANTIAVVLNNGWDPSWDNVAFDVGLKGIFRDGVATVVSVRRVSASGSSILLEVAGTPGTVWRLEAAEALSTNSSWDYAASVVIPEAGSIVLAQPMGVSGGHFFRLVPD